MTANVLKQITGSALHLSFHCLTSSVDCNLIKGIALKMLCFVLINSVLLTVLSVWTL